jgi:RNA polymerase sigma factor (sigma-70 family)
VEGRPLDDAELIRNARRGDQDAYAELVKRYQHIALRVAHVIAGATDANDVAQEALVKAWRALDRFRDGEPFRPWLLRIVANEARNNRRSAGRRVGLVLRAAVADGRPSADAAPSAEEAVLGAEQRRRILAAVESLPERDRDVIACRYLAGLSEAETGAVLGCRLGTVKSRTSRALDRLRARLEATTDPVPDKGGVHG